ncbi:MAG: M3 family metallopeptidase [Thermomicrobiales bacterium]
MPARSKTSSERVTLTKANYQRFIESRNRDVRQAAFIAMHSAYRKQRNTIAATYSSSVKADVFMARTRHYESALDAALKPKNIPESVYDALVESVNDHLPLLHRYIALRKRVLGLEQLGVYDLHVPIVPEVEEEYSYDAALDTVLYRRSGRSATTMAGPRFWGWIHVGPTSTRTKASVAEPIRSGSTVSTPTSC